jgi:phosphoglycolate phosphatase-like HAD superfamily hydrolase
MPKSAAVEVVLNRTSCRREEALLIGDSLADYQAARSAGIEFLLRRTSFNRELQQLHTGTQCDHFAA